MHTKNDDGEFVSLCAYATDKSDCPPRFLVTLGPTSFATVHSPGMPAPPPSPPRPPPSPPSKEYFVPCSEECVDRGLKPDAMVETCSDGGLGSFLVDHAFLCDYGTDCAACGSRLPLSETPLVDDDVSGRNGVCEDTAAGGTLGYGTVSALTPLHPVL